VGERLPKLIAALTVALGVAAVLAGASVFVEAWQASRAWAGSSEARHAAVPSEAPVWLDAGVDRPAEQIPVLPVEPVSPLPASVGQPSARDPGVPVPGGVATRPTAPVTISTLPPDGHAVDAAARDVPTEVASTRIAPPDSLAIPAATTEPEPAVSAATAAPADVELAEVDFRFLDPPEPGAHARIAVSLVNHASVPTGPLRVAVSTRWLNDFKVFGAIPGVLDDRALGDDQREFVFPGLQPGERQTVELHVLATAEEVDAPEVRLLLGDAGEVGRARPRTVAPRPRPGPARAVTIPKLGVKASVVPVPWEPPPFVIGQVQGTAAVSLGNTVLIGHLAGPQGDVFARLDRLRPGDEVVATSRGLEYRFVVSEIAVRPYDDVGPTTDTSTPRLTLMTCTGQWNIRRQDYSHRLWVIAEPPELAAQTIKANAERAAQAAREAEEGAAARATHEAETAGSPGNPEVASNPRTAEVASTGPIQPVGPVEAAPTVATSSQSAGVATAPALSAETPVVAGVDAPGDRRATVDDTSAATDSAAVDGSNPNPDQLVSGVVIDSPVADSPVERRLTVRGRRTSDIDPRAALWLLVRADVPGSKWYALDRPLEPDKDGRWRVEIELGGAPGIRHEIRVGITNLMADTLLRRHAVDRAGQPLDDLPEGFESGARVTVERR
jgi:hypothetical protein